MFEFFKRSAKKEPEAPISNIATLVREGDNLLSDSLILLDERLSGNLFCAEEIVVEQNGILSGNMTAKRCIVSGTINGDIVSTDEMNIKSTAVIRGTIKSPAINIEPGAIINGKVIIATDNKAGAKLMERINNHSADEYLSAKLAAEKAEQDSLEALAERSIAVPKAVVKPAVPQLQDKPVTINHGEPDEARNPFVQPKPQPVPIQKTEDAPFDLKSEETPVTPTQSKPLVAPTPKVENKPADDGANQRWW